VAEKPRTLGERMLLVENWQSTHEKACADRWLLLLRIMFAGLAILIGIASWGLNKVFDGQQQQLNELRAVSAQVATKP
jgi:hypothetical protein